MNNALYDLETCRSITDDELVALESIFPDALTRNDTPEFTTIKLELPIDLGSVREVRVFDDGSTATSSAAKSDGASISLLHLPPIILDLKLPATYPLHDPPKVLSAYASQSWLSPSLMILLLHKIHSLWLEQRDLGEGVLWRISEMITTGDFLLDPSLPFTRASIITIPHPAPHMAMPVLFAHNKSMLDSSFSSTTFTCPICLEPRKGSACIELACKHVTCKECLREYWSLSVREGECAKVRCVAAECVKKTAAHGQDENGRRKAEEGEAGEEDVRRVLTEDEVARWKWLRQKRATDRDPTTVHCPLQFCQAPVPRPATAVIPEDQKSGAYSSGWERLRTCDHCGFSFCVFCKKSWHGPITPCNTPTSNAFLIEYMALPEGAPRRREMELMMGRENVRRMVRKYEEDEKNRKWLEESTTACPGCSVRCEKSFGCNHMTCARCNTHYCYRCGEGLSALNPYTHFSTRGGTCYNKLFDYEAGEEDAWVPMGLDFL